MFCRKVSCFYMLTGSTVASRIARRFAGGNRYTRSSSKVKNQKPSVQEDKQNTVGPGLKIEQAHTFNLGTHEEFKKKKKRTMRYFGLASLAGFILLVLNNKYDNEIDLVFQDTELNKYLVKRVPSLLKVPFRHNNSRTSPLSIFLSDSWRSFMLASLSQHL
jgi:hypothetical protein